jgi:WG containing repeat
MIKCALITFIVLSSFLVYRIVYYNNYKSKRVVWENYSDEIQSVWNERYKFIRNNLTYGQLTNNTPCAGSITSNRESARLVGLVIEELGVDIPSEFFGISEVYDNFVVVRACTRQIGRTYGVVDFEGNWIVLPQFRYIDDLIGDMARVDIDLSDGAGSGSQWPRIKNGYISVTGDVIEPQYDYATDFEGDYALVGNRTFFSRVIYSNGFLEYLMIEGAGWKPRYWYSIIDKEGKKVHPSELKKTINQK